MKNSVLRIALADDHPIVLSGLRTLLNAEPDFQVVGETQSGLEVIPLVQNLKPDVLVLDLSLPGRSGLELAREVCQRFPETRIVVLSVHSADAYVLEALRYGVAGYVLKEAPAPEIVHAVRVAAAGQRYLSPPLSERAIDLYIQQGSHQSADPLLPLTAREREVFLLTARGNSSTAVGELLGISPRTVETHRSNLMRKLGLHNQAELVRYALHHRLLPPEP